MSNDYWGVSEIGKEFLAELGIKEGLDADPMNAAESHYPELLNDSLLFSAVKTLWKLGKRDEKELSDVATTVFYLSRWLVRLRSSSPKALIFKLLKRRLIKRVYGVMEKLSDRYLSRLDDRTAATLRIMLEKG